MTAGLPNYDMAPDDDDDDDELLRLLIGFPFSPPLTSSQVLVEFFRSANRPNRVSILSTFGFPVFPFSRPLTSSLELMPFSIFHYPRVT